MDKSHGASVEYECFPGMGSTQPGSCRHLVRGNFQLDNRTYLLEPDASSGLTLHNHDDTDDVIHVIYEIQEEHDFKTDYIVTEHVKSESHVLHATSTKGYTPQKTRRRKRSIINYKVEFLPVLDYPIYKFWYDRSNATTAAARDVDAIENIREFYAFVLNSIDLRYQSIVSTTIAIQVVFAGIFIADTPSASTWTENYKVSATPRDKVDASVALTAFKQWLALQTSLPAYDHAMAFTGYDLVRNGSSSIAGLAWTPGACNHAIPYANSISQDHFDAGLATTAAHELGHNLGSKHDGEDNVCSADDKYVMSPSTGGVTDARAINHFKFSTCSVTQIESYIATLDRDNNNCLLTSSFNSSALDLYDGLEAGLLYSADVQCEANVGPGSYFCRSLYTDISEMCARMMCSVPGNNTCITNTAWEGTVCGNQKLCRRGVCTCDTKASSVPDNCPQGDRPGAYVNNMTCKAATTANPMYCYQAAFLINCCESCRQYYIGVMGCEYGDHSTGCRLSSCPNYDAATLASGCCGTCGNTSATSGNSVSPSTCPQTSTSTTSSMTTSPISTSSSSTSSISTSTTTSTTTAPSTTTSTTTIKTTTPSTTTSSTPSTRTTTTTSSSTYSTSTATKITTLAPSSTSSTGSTSTAAPLVVTQTPTTFSTKSTDTATEKSTASRTLFSLLVPVLCIVTTFILF